MSRGIPTYGNVHRPEKADNMEQNAFIAKILPIPARNFRRCFGGYLSFFAVVQKFIYFVQDLPRNPD